MANSGIIATILGNTLTDSGIDLSTKADLVNGTVPLSQLPAISVDSSARTIQTYTATASQTTFTVTGGYVVGLVDVYINGIKLAAADYTASNGTTVVLGTGTSLNNVVEVVKYNTALTMSNALRTITKFTATAGQTVFTVSYNPGLVDVFYNGSKLDSTEYTATNGTDITLTTAASLNDVLEVIAYSYQAGAFTGIGGSGTVNKLAKFTASGTIGDSLITDNGTTVTFSSNLVAINGNGLTEFKINNNTSEWELYMPSGGTDLRLYRGTDKVTFLANGNVGIGTTNPDNTYQGLTIYGTNPSLRLKSSATGSWNWIEFVNSSGSNNFSMGVSQSTPIFVIKAGAGLDNPNFAMSSAGNVSIGTVSSRSVSGYTFLTVNGSTKGGYLDLYYSGTHYGSIGVETDGTSVLSVGKDIYFGTTVSGSYYERLRITNGGAVGVNLTPYAGSALEVKALSANSLAFQVRASDGNNTVYISPNNSGFNRISSNYMVSGPYLPLSLTARENNGDLVLFANGNISIGSTTDLGTKLQVNGANYIEMATFAATAASASTIVSNNAGYVQFSLGTARHCSNSALFVPTTDGIQITKAGILYISFSQDITSAGTTGYVAGYIRKNGTNISENLITNTNSQWDGLTGIATINVAANDVIGFWINASDITSLDAGTWSQYSFIWAAR